jgi:TFIIF-interacting CTD phosphatase-like protein
MERINFFLDLDQTLISAEATEEFDFEKDKVKAKKFRYSNMQDYYVVFERPGLQEFLTYLFENFNVSVWTAASKDYALYVIEKIVLAGNSNRKLDYVLFSYHCDVAEKIGKGTKDLSVLWEYFCLKGYNKENTLILDDYDEVYNTQKSNCIVAKPFEFQSSDSPEDDFLKKLENILRNRKAGEDVQILVKNANQKLRG